MEEENQLSKKIIMTVAENNAVKYVQALELLSFIFAGFILGLSYQRNTDFIFLAAAIFIVGVFLAIIAGESAIEEFKLIGEKK